MANVLDLMGYVANILGAPATGKTVTLKNNATGATVGSPTTTDADGKWAFANQDESLSYEVEVAVGGASSQVISRRPWSGEMLSLYVRDELRTNASATVAFGGAVSVATGGLTVTAGGLTVSAGGAAITGTLAVTGAATVSTTLGVTGAATFSSTVATGALTATGNIAGSALITAATGLRATSGGCVITAGGLTVSAGGAAITGAITATTTITAATGLVATTGGLTVSAGGASITGAITASTTITAGTGLTVSAGGITATGNSTVTGTLNVTSTLTQNSVAVSTNPGVVGGLLANTAFGTGASGVEASITYASLNVPAGAGGVFARWTTSVTAGVNCYLYGTSGNQETGIYCQGNGTSATACGFIPNSGGADRVYIKSPPTTSNGTIVVTGYTLK